MDSEKAQISPNKHFESTEKVQEFFSPLLLATVTMQPCPALQNRAKSEFVRGICLPNAGKLDVEGCFCELLETTRSKV